MLQNCAAGGLLLTQLLLYPWLVQKKGYRFCITLGMFTVVAISFPFPLYGLMADPAKFGAWRMVPLGSMMLVQMSAFGLCIPTLTVWVNRLADGLDRGTINGWTNAFAALCRALTPELCSTLLGLGLNSSPSPRAGTFRFTSRRCWLSLCCCLRGPCCLAARLWLCHQLRGRAARRGRGGSTRAGRRHGMATRTRPCRTTRRRTSRPEHRGGALPGGQAA